MTPVTNHRVVAAAIVDSLQLPTKLLVATRSYPRELAGRIEFPGGKVENTETPQEALQREIDEELETRLTIGSPICPSPGNSWWKVSDRHIMAIWFAQVAPQAPAPTCGTSHSSVEWVDIESIHTLNWLDGDLPIAFAIQQILSAK